MIGLFESSSDNGIKTDILALGIPKPLLTVTLPTMTP